MTDQLEVTKFEDLNVLDKSVSILRLYINEVVVAEGTINEIAEKIGQRKESIYVAVNRNKNGEAKLKKYRLELIEYVSYPKKEYEVLLIDRQSGHEKALGIGTIDELEKMTGYSASYLRRLATPHCREKLLSSYKTRRRFEEILVVEIEKEENENE